LSFQLFTQQIENGFIPVHNNCFNACKNKWLICMIFRLFMFFMNNYG
jgi:hypothetical protein